MYSRDDLMRILGLSYRQLRERLDLFAAESSLLDGKVRQGAKGKTYYDVAVLEMLRELAQVASTSRQPLRQAVAELATRINGNGNGNGSNGNGKVDGNRVNLEGNHNGEEALILRGVVESQAEQIRWLQGQVERLTAMLNDAQEKVLALPSGKQRAPWWAWGPFRLLWG